MKYLFLLLTTFILSSQTIASGKLSVFFTQNDIERKLIWQCEEMAECIQILETRIEETGGCDPRVTKITLERVNIPGIDDA